MVVGYLCMCSAMEFLAETYCEKCGTFSKIVFRLNKVELKFINPF